MKNVGEKLEKDKYFLETEYSFPSILLYCFYDNLFCASRLEYRPGSVNIYLFIQ